LEFPTKNKTKCAARVTGRSEAPTWKINQYGKHWHRGITTHMVKYIYTVLIPSNLMTLIRLYLHNSQLLEQKKIFQYRKKCIFDLERRKYIPWGKLFETS
jgi:hypothetical protein